ncbi:hypothetical protein G3570_12450 [Balneolaceae bacterium YR4-1]|uniref:Uncharacterized protein n=1 Tax=Halalkalibaculum roseum TaxID=2709311 RepID=A0A6M1SWM1_9BACT|nr:hypothetical protein [Halalkalibaculum roseum]NGP77450.1 hypothetical protein [Halalkalibaculum roseum]
MKKTMFLWMAAGVLFVALAFFIPAQEGSIWPSVIAGSVASLVYLIALSIYGIRKIDSSGKRKVVTSTLVLLVVFSIVSAGISYEGSKRQTALLPEIRNMIETQIAEYNVKKYLLETMKTYYIGENYDGNAGLGSIFRTKYDTLITEESRLLYEGKDTYKDEKEDLPVKIFVKTIDPDSIILVAESAYIDGKNADFENYSGAMGYFQTEGILTKEGIRYERAN